MGVVCYDEVEKCIFRLSEKVCKAVSASVVRSSGASMMATCINEGWWLDSSITEV